MAGRKTKYNKELLEKCAWYLQNWAKLDEEFPSNTGLALYINISESLLYDWCKHERKKPFLDIVQKIKLKQKLVLRNKGITGEFNPTITKLLLTKHGYTDKVEGTQIGPDGKPINTGTTVIIQEEYVDAEEIED